MEEGTGNFHPSAMTAIEFAHLALAALAQLLAIQLDFDAVVGDLARCFRDLILCTSILTSLESVSEKGILLEYIQSNMSERPAFLCQTQFLMTLNLGC